MNSDSQFSSKVKVIATDQSRLNRLYVVICLFACLVFFFSLFPLCVQKHDSSAQIVGLHIALSVIC